MKKEFLFLWLIFFTTPVLAVEPDEMLKDPALEQRARDLSRDIRCLVCQGEDIDASRAGLASDLRKLLRQRIAAGDSDAEAVEYIHARYGDAVLMRPPVDGDTYILWFFPAALLLGGCGVVLWRKKWK